MKVNTHSVTVMDDAPSKLVTVDKLFSILKATVFVVSADERGAEIDTWLP
jgi:hypothetical protein